MSLIGRLFGTEKEHLPLDPSSPAAARLERDRPTVEEFARKVRDKLELVPGDRAIYVFIGRPPDAFGIAWLEGGEGHNFKRLMKGRGPPRREAQARPDELRAPYPRSKDEPRYTADFRGKHVLVTP